MTEAEVLDLEVVEAEAEVLDLEVVEAEADVLDLEVVEVEPVAEVEPAGCALVVEE